MGRYKSGHNWNMAINPNHIQARRIGVEVKDNNRRSEEYIGPKTR